MILAMVIIFDVILIVIANLLATVCYLEYSHGNDFIKIVGQQLPVMLYVSMASFYILGLYNRRCRYASIEELANIAAGAGISMVVVSSWVFVLDRQLHAGLIFNYYLFTVFLVGLGRQLIRFFKLLIKKHSVRGLRDGRFCRLI